MLIKGRVRKATFCHLRKLEVTMLSYYEEYDSMPVSSKWVISYSLFLRFRPYVGPLVEDGYLTDWGKFVATCVLYPRGVKK